MSASIVSACLPVTAAFNGKGVDVVSRPVPSGDNDKRSVARSTEFVPPSESSYRPAPPRTTVLPSADGVHARPNSGANLNVCERGGASPPGPRIGVNKVGLVRAFSGFGSYHHPTAEFNETREPAGHEAA